MTGSGIHFHRIINPLAYLPQVPDRNVSIVHVGEQELNIQCDVLLYNKWTWALSVDQVKAMKVQGTKIVVDVDDHWDIPVWHSQYQHIKDGQIDTKTIEHIRLADVVTCTTKRLAEKVQELNKNVVVIPNALPFDRDQYQPGDRVRAREITGNDKTRFMYMGGRTHRADIDLLSGKFERIGGEKYLTDRAEFLLCGYEPTKQAMYNTREDMEAKNGNYKIKEIQGEYDYMANVFRKTNSFKIYPSVDLENYLNYYDSTDVALVPLVENSWNSYKSELKLVEAGCKHVPVICSAVAPYTDAVLFKQEGVMMVENADQWIDYIRYCIKNPNFVQDQGERLYNWTKENYDLIKVNQLREQVFNSL